MIKLINSGIKKNMGFLINKNINSKMNKNRKNCFGNIKSIFMAAAIEYINEKLKSIDEKFKHIFSSL